MSDVTGVRETTRAFGLAAAARRFAGRGSPRIVAVAAVAGRVIAGRWSLADLVVALVILAIEPFAEWLLHVFVLPLRPREIAGRRIDPSSRAATACTTGIRAMSAWCSCRCPCSPASTLVSARSAGCCPDHRLGLTAFATMTRFLFGYECSHYLIHSPYVPRPAAFRAVWRAHILHHYKNEQFWFGVTNPVADHVLRTNPDKDAVPTSATARTLGVDDELSLLRPQSA